MTYQPRAVLALAASLLAFRVSAQADEGAAYRAMIDKHAAAIVTVKLVLKVESSAGGQARSNETRLTVPGVVVSEDGLVMMTNQPFSPQRGAQLMGSDMPEGMTMKMTPTTVKLVVPGDEKEIDAFLAATDANLDLAFIKAEGLGNRKLPFVDFSATPSAEVGNLAMQVVRLGKGYDYAACVQSSRVSGKLAKPRTALILDGSIGTLGLPVFTAAGEPLGVLTTLLPGAKAEDAGESASFAHFMAQFSGGTINGGAFVLPPSAVKGLVEQARARAPEVAAERARRKAEEKPAEKPVDKPGTKPAAQPAKPGAKPGAKP